jgi:hypothetical protein
MSACLSGLKSITFYIVQGLFSPLSPALSTEIIESLASLVGLYLKVTE